MHALDMDTAKHRFQASDHEARQSMEERHADTGHYSSACALPERGDVVITFFSLEGARFNSPATTSIPNALSRTPRNALSPIETNRR